MRPTVVWLHGLAAFALLVGGHPLLAILVVVPALMMADGPNDVLRVLWRWRAVRRATRTWSTRCLHRESGCHTCGGAPGEPCDADTHMLAESHSMTDWEVAGNRRDNRIATRDAQATGVVTTFRGVTAMRAAARTGDWAAYAAADTTPVTESLAAIESRMRRDEERGRP